jgi:hypothetical protein
MGFFVFFQIDWEVREVELEGIQQHPLVLPDETLAGSLNADQGARPDVTLSQQLQQSLELNR